MINEVFKQIMESESHCVPYTKLIFKNGFNE